MRFIYLVKLGQLAAVLAVVWFYLSVGQFCGDIEVKTHHEMDATPTPDSNSSLHHKHMSIRVHWSLILQPEPERFSSTHWTNKVDEVRQKKNKTGIPHTTKSSNDTVPEHANLRVQVQIIEEDAEQGTTFIPVTEAASTLSSGIDLQRFEWHADGCILVSLGDFFSADPQTHAASIAFQVMWSVVLVACHALLILFHLYLVYASYLPPSSDSDFVRSKIGFALWYFALANLVYVHYTWKDDWSTVNIVVMPKFPANWIIIELISTVMLVVLIAEAYCRAWLYSNMRIVPTIIAVEATNNNDAPESIDEPKNPEETTE